MNKTIFALYSIALCLFMLSCASFEGAGKSIEAPIAYPSSELSSSSRAEPAAPSEIDGGMLVDSRDGKKYKIAAIGAQTWMAENLAYAAKKSKCYNNESANCEKYGRLYSWDIIGGEEAEGAGNVCPGGWRLPKSADWKALADRAGGQNAGKKFKSKDGWNKFSGKDGNGSDDYGFSALAGGLADADGNFKYIGDLGFWWIDNENAHSEFTGSWYINSRGLIKANDFFGIDESYFSSVRCVKE